MTDFNQEEPLDPRIQDAVRAIQAEKVNPGRVIRLKEQARRLNNLRIWEKPFVRAQALAAAVAIVVFACSILLYHGSSSAFAQVLEKIKEAKTVRLTMTVKLGQQPEMPGSLIGDGNRVRIETLDGMLVEIIDLDARKILALDTQNKVGHLFPVAEDNRKLLVNPIQQLRQAKAKDAERLGEEVIDGRRTTSYRIRKINFWGIKGTGEMLVWADQQTELPVRVVIRDPDPTSQMEIRLDKITWNEPVDADKIVLKMPAGYKEGIVLIEPELKKETEKSLEVKVENAESLLRLGWVAGSITWDADGKTVVALLRDPETVPAIKQRQKLLASIKVANGKVLWSVPVKGASMLSQSPDGKLIAVVVGQEVQLRDMANGKIIRIWESYDHVYSLAFSPDGKTLAGSITHWNKPGDKSGKSEGGVFLWDTANGNLIRTLKEEKPTTFVRWLPDGKLLATSSNEGPIHLRNPSTGSVEKLFPGRLAASMTSNSSRIAYPVYRPGTDKFTGVVEVSSIEGAKLLQTLMTGKGEAASFLLGVALSPDNSQLAAWDWNGTVSVWNLANGQRLDLPAGHKGGVVSGAFSPDGKTLATGSEDGTIRLWKLEEFREILKK